LIYERPESGHRERLRDGRDGEDRCAGHRLLARYVAIAVAFGENDFAILHNRDSRAGDFEFRHGLGHVVVEPVQVAVDCRGGNWDCQC